MRKALTAFAAWLLLAGTALAGWHFVEARRLERELARTQSLADLIGPARMTSLTREDEGAASRYYRAAAALVGRQTSAGSLFNARIGRAESTNEWPDDLVREMRGRLASSKEALSYLDKAAALEFDGFPPSNVYETRHLDFFDLHAANRIRVALAILDGNTGAAASSLYAGLRLQRITGFRSFNGPGPIARRSDGVAALFLVRQLQAVVSGTRPSTESLALLAAGFAALDDDDLILHDLSWSRGMSTQVGNRPWLQSDGATVAAALATVARPFALRELKEQLQQYGDAIDAQTGKGWPDRLEAITDRDDRLPSPFVVRAQSIADELALIRSARTMIAIEQFRRANSERLPADWSALSQIQVPLIDPYSGKQLRIVTSRDRYVVYSIGSNSRDDGAAVEDLRIAVTLIPNP